MTAIAAPVVAFFAGITIGLVVIAFIVAGKAGEADARLRGALRTIRILEESATDWMLERDKLARKLEQIRALLEGDPSP